MPTGAEIFKLIGTAGVRADNTAAVELVEAESGGDFARVVAAHPDVRFITSRTLREAGGDQGAQPTAAPTKGST